MTDKALDIATPLVAGFEGFRPYPYRDAVGVWTIGYGSTRLADGTAVAIDTPSVTQAEAQSLLELVLTKFAHIVDEAVPPETTDNQRAALYSFAYNEGPRAFLQSTLLKELKAGNIQNAADQFMAWVYAGGQKLAGLERRRKAEQTLFLKDDTANV